MVADRPPYAPEREVRFAIVMYGGVSLAIYINGVSQELFRLVRATAPSADGRSLYLADSELSGSERVYREVGRRLKKDGAVTSRFVVDILSGTSAGGINAIFLAKALANGQDIDLLRRLWIEEGDIDILFNEKGAYRGLPEGVKYSSPPSSLLAGQRLYVRALEALRKMGPRRAKNAPAYADQVDLAITTTDLQGLSLPIQLTDRAVDEVRHRMVLRFVYATEDATGDHRNDFESNDELLAFAARATSSFPFAFEPVTLSDVEAAEPGALAAIQKQGGRYFGDHTRMQAPYESYAFADGGYLDNKPFTYATNTLRRRRADVPVERKLLYIEPDPGAAPDEPNATARARPDALGNVGAAVKLPHAETIRDDIAAVTERNGAIERIRRVTRDIELAALGAPDAAPAPAQLLAYHRLRRLDTLDDLTALITRATGLAAESDDARGVRLLLDAWAPDEGPGLQQFLAHFDLRFRLRRLTMLQDRLSDLLTGGRATERLLAASGATIGPEEAARDCGNWLRARKVGLNELFVSLRRQGREVRAREEATGPQATPTIAQAAAGLTLDRENLLWILVGHDPLTRAGELLAAPERSEAIQAFEIALREQFAPAFAEADTRLTEELTAPGSPAEAELSNLLAAYAGATEVIDMAVLALSYPDLREVNPVEIFRISPDDAPGLVPVAEDGPPRLAGAAFGHFGGFLDQGWRRSDLLWGRLDGAERLLASTVPHVGEREKLRVQAQAAILREELHDDNTGALAGLLDDTGQMKLPEALADDDDAALLQVFKKHYRGPRALESGPALKLAGRGVGITGEVLQGVADGRGQWRKPMFWLARMGRLLWGFAELAVPGGMRTRGLQHYWIQLLVLLAAVLVTAGVLGGVEGADTTGWLLLGAVVLVTLLGWLMQGLIKKRVLAVIATVLALALLVLAGVGVAAVVDSI